MRIFFNRSVPLYRSEVTGLSVVEPTLIFAVVTRLEATWLTIPAACLTPA
jgi:hypothetical protein